jgi:hypothetical protein
MAMKKAVCAYCGVNTETEREHAIPATYAPVEVRGGCKWVFVPACGLCVAKITAAKSAIPEQLG